MRRIALRKPFLEMPLLRKELVGLLRTRRAFWLLVLAVSFSCLLPLLAWPRNALNAGGPDMAIFTTLTFLLTQLTAALLITPAFAAGAISGEREQGTYELLHATLISPASIVISKALAACLYIIILLVATAPAVTVLHLLGGVGFESILQSYAVTFAAVVLSTLVCLSASMRSERTSRAVVLGVLGVVFWNGGLLFLLSLAAMIFLRASPPAPSMTQLAMYASCALSPHGTIGIQTLELGGLGGPMLGFPVEPWLIHLAFASLLSLLYFLVLLVRVRTPGSSLPLADRLAPRRPAARRRPVRRPLSTRLIVAAAGDSGPLANPVFLKEIRSEFTGRLWYRLSVFLGSSAIFLGLVSLMEPGRGALDSALTGVVCIALFLVGVLAPGVAASSFPREVEQGNIDFLRGTLMSLPEILRGKYLASLHATLGIIMSAGYAVVLAGILAPSDSAWIPATPYRPPAARVILSFLVLVTTWVFITAVAMAASVIAKRTLGALIGSYAALIVWFVVTPVVLLATVLDDETLLTAVHPMGALQTAVSQSREIGPLAVFFLIYVSLTLLLWCAAATGAERLRARDR